MDLPDESQWDETTCNVAICQHPQCWATIRRIERGHPRILGSPSKTPMNINDKLPVLTIVNLSGSCFQVKRRPRRYLPGLTFTKPHSLLSRGLKFDSKFQGRPRKDLTDKKLISCTNRSFKLPVLNLNKTQIPCPHDVSNMVVVWIPKEPEEHVRPAEQSIAPSQDGKKKRKTAIVKGRSSLVLSGRQNIEPNLRTPRIIVPPSSPEHYLERLSSEFLPFLNQFDTLPQDLLKVLLSDEETTTPGLEMKTQLAQMKKTPPLRKSRPDSAISGQMCLSAHRLTLHRPALRYPAHLRKLCGDMKTESLRKQQQQQQQQQEQQRKLKKPEAHRKSKSDPGSQSTSHKPLGAVGGDPHEGHRTLPGPESDKKHQQEQQQRRKQKSGPILEQDSTEKSQMGSENYLDSNPELSKTESTSKAINAQMEVVPEAQEDTPKDLSASSSRLSWNSELKLLKILQSSDDEDEEASPGTQS